MLDCTRFDQIQHTPTGRRVLFVKRRLRNLRALPQADPDSGHMWVYLNGRLFQLLIRGFYVHPASPCEANSYE